MKIRNIRLHASKVAVISAIAGVFLAVTVGILSNLIASVSKDSLKVLLPFLIAALGMAWVAAYIIFKYQRRVSVRKKDQIMLIYAKEDIQVAEKVNSLLTEAGFKTWMDIQDLLPGQLWRDSIVSAIEESKLLVVLLSQNSFKNSGFVRKELSLALDVLEEPREGFSSLIPVRIEPVDIPIDRLKEIQWVDLFSGNGSIRLVETISLLMLEPSQQ
ncbi:MAG: toll/interleukin-1 receptor domain-containing protein [Anaerolineales bacterium]